MQTQKNEKGIGKSQFKAIKSLKDLDQLHCLYHKMNEKQQRQTWDILQTSQKNDLVKKGFPHLG